MSQPHPPFEPSPDPYQPFPLYSPPADPPPRPTPAAAPTSAAMVPGAPPPLPARAFASWQVLTDERPPNTVVTVVAWVVTVLTGLYMLPWAIAATRGKANQWGVFAGNLLLGWTVVGWIVALVLACTAHRPLYPASPMVTVGPVMVAQPGWYPSPDDRGMRYFDGLRWTAHQQG